MSQEEMPLRFFRAFGRAVQETIEHHEAHCPTRHQRPMQELPRGTVTAIPFPERTICDEALAKIVEDIETDPSTTLEELASRHGHPPSVIARYLPAYQLRYRRWIRSQCHA